MFNPVTPTRRELCDGCPNYIDPLDHHQVPGRESTERYCRRCVAGFNADPTAPASFKSRERGTISGATHEQARAAAMMEAMRPADLDADAGPEPADFAAALADSLKADGLL